MATLTPNLEEEAGTVVDMESMLVVVVTGSIASILSADLHRHRHRSIEFSLLGDVQHNVKS